jgi:glycosyltransferase involved in cell wall biosynthesis
MSRRRGDAALVLVRNDVTHDARVLRHARLLAGMGFETTIVGVRSQAGQPAREAVDGLTVDRVKLPRRPSAARAPAAVRPAPVGDAGRLPPRVRIRRAALGALYAARVSAMVIRRRPAVVHCNDLNTMWPGVVARLLGAGVVYDAHELWPDRNGRFENRAWLLACEWLFVRVATATTTTSPGYAATIARRHRTRLPVLVPNVPAPAAGAAPARVLERPPLALYVGAVTRGRGLEAAIRALAHVPGLRLRVQGPGAAAYRAHLRELAARAGVADRVELADPVAPARLDAAIREAGATFGLALIEPVCLSYRLTLPNKLHEYAVAGLPVLASDLPVIGAWVREHGVGATTDAESPEAIAAAMRAMLDPVAQRAWRAAAGRLLSRAPWREAEGRMRTVYRSVARGR